MKYDTIDLFAGPGGWDEGARLLGQHERIVGVEWDDAACRTARAAGHVHIRADVSTLPREPFRAAGFTGMIASPPCQAFSAAGKGLGLDDVRGELVFQVLEWADALRPEWIACEQVKEVLPIWRLFALELKAMGYFTWYGILNAADYGVPQTRKRAILMARRTPFTPPSPTHSEKPHRQEDDLFGGAGLEPWVTMAEALGWNADDEIGFERRNDLDDGAEYRVRDKRTADEPAFALTSKARSWSRKPKLQPDTWADGRENGNRRMYDADEPAPPLHFGSDSGGWKWTFERPATTVVSSFRPDVIAAPGWRNAGDGPRQDAEGSVQIEAHEAGILQTFPANYPWQGSRTKQFQQIGNAIPCRLASCILRELMT
jgi:DNA (cytosine-5)-methyltransferase 1